MINKRPYIEVDSKESGCFEGWDKIAIELNRKVKEINKKKVVIAVDCYHGTYADVNLNTLKNQLSPNVTCRAKDIYKDEVEIRSLVKKSLNEESQNVKYSTYTIEDYFDINRLEALRSNIDFIDEGVILIHGIGAHKIWPSDIIVYSDMSKYEILQRFRRNEISNIGVFNDNDTFDLHHKWSYFIDWLICDKIKKLLLPQCDYFLETNNWNKPKLAKGNVVRQAYELATQQPLFMAPFFDPELWDKNARQELPSAEDFSWGFNCDFEEDNVLLKIGEYLFETPAINIVLFDAIKFLGQAVYRRYGSELPIRFNFIDTQEEDTIELYVYPGTDYLKDNFSTHKHQCENLYLMDVGGKSKLHAGLKEDISSEYFCGELLKSKTKSHRKALTRLLNKIDVKKHDHFFLPPETIYKPADNAITLKISTSPSLFKWNLNEIKENRLAALDNFAKNNPPAKYLRKNLFNQISKLAAGDYEEELLAPELNQHFRLTRIWFDNSFTLHTDNNIQVLNLIEGTEVLIKSTNDSFKPVQVHYAETFVVPANIEKVTITPVGKGKFALLRAFLKSQ